MVLGIYFFFAHLSFENTFFIGKFVEELLQSICKTKLLGINWQKCKKKDNKIYLFDHSDHG
jgi:hypothetical protein